MKWYTFEEKRPIKGDSGLFALTDGRFMEGFIIEEKRKKRLVANNEHAFHEGYTLDNIWYWIPEKDLIMSLPKEKHINFFLEVKRKEEEQFKKEREQWPECENECGTCSLCLGEKDIGRYQHPLM